MANMDKEKNGYLELSGKYPVYWSRFDHKKEIINSKKRGANEAFDTISGGRTNRKALVNKIVFPWIFLCYVANNNHFIIKQA